MACCGRESERGVCRVLCFHPDHSLTLAGMEVADIVRVVEAWTAEFIELGARPEIRHVQIFENRGAMMGASNPHPHGQIWATEHIPDEPAAEVANQRAYRQQHDACLLCDTLKARTRAAPAHRVSRIEEFVVAGAVLGGVAVRDPGAQPRAIWGAWTHSAPPSNTGWRIFSSS